MSRTADAVLASSESASRLFSPFSMSELRSALIMLHDHLTFRADHAMLPMLCMIARPFTGCAVITLSRPYMSCYSWYCFSSCCRVKMSSTSPHFPASLPSSPELEIGRQYSLFNAVQQNVVCAANAFEKDDKLILTGRGRRSIRVSPYAMPRRRMSFF